MERRFLLAVLGTLFIACDSAEVPLAPSTATDDVAILGEGNVATFTGRGTALDATVLGVNTKTCDVSLPRLGGRAEGREVSSSIAGLAATNLYCFTGSRTNKATAEADGRSLVLNLGGNTITADRFKSMVGAECPPDADPTNFGNAAVLRLVVNGRAIWVRNTPNQKVDLPNGYIVLWEENKFVTRFHAGRTITAMRVVINKPEPTADIAIARSQTHIDCP
jgi:hypothetical protein